MNNYQDERLHKDHFFGSDPNSPLLPEQKAGFEGLKYFPADGGLRFEDRGD